MKPAAAMAASEAACDHLLNNCGCSSWITAAVDVSNPNPSVDKHACMTRALPFRVLTAAFNMQQSSHTINRKKTNSDKSQAKQFLWTAGIRVLCSSGSHLQELSSIHSESKAT